jgi:hypothetical protein
LETLYDYEKGLIRSLQVRFFDTKSIESGPAASGLKGWRTAWGAAATGAGRKGGPAVG